MTDQHKDDPDLDPYEINFRPEFKKGRGPKAPFRNAYGVLIGDHEYASPDSPLENWTEDTDPAIMAGDHWVHPFKDIGFHRKENRAYFEEGSEPKPGTLLHPNQDAAYEVYASTSDSGKKDHD